MMPSFAGIAFVLHLNGLQCMQVEGSQLSLEAVKKRLVTIIDNHARTLSTLLQRESKRVLAFNEALLQEWTDILQRMLFLRDAKPSQVRPINPTNNQLPSLPHLPQPYPILSVHSHLVSTDANACELYKVTSNSSKLSIKSSKLLFPKGYFRKYCSYNFIDAENVVLIGGSRDSNPNMKSKEVFIFNLYTEDVSKLAELPYGVSSHAAVRVKDCIFVIGGNKDMNIVTKSCLSFNFITRQVETIASLNYAAASTAAVLWKEEYIYKMGGVGSCFGSWDLSPYIQRYSLAQKQWEVINPTLKVDEKLLDRYSLLANSLAIACKDSILILGGFDFHFRSSSKLMQLKIDTEQHEITRIATVEGLQPGGFFQQDPLLFQGQVFALQSIQDPKEGYKNKVVSISTRIIYP